MKFEVKLTSKSGEKKHVVELTREGERWSVALDGRPTQADAIEIAPNLFSILLNGQSHEIRIARAADGKLALQCGLNEFIAEVADPRAWRGRRLGHVEVEGRQQITAPMAGKVVRVLVQTGDKVETGQGLLVVEAMKMQNEIRSPKAGAVERLMVKEGQPINAGDTLALIN